MIDYKIKVLSEAQSNIDEAMQWYFERSNTAALNFLDEIDITISNIKDNPYAYPLKLDNIRYTKINKYPYAIFYRINKKEIVILKIYHLKREPDSWQNS